MGDMVRLFVSGPHRPGRRHYSCCVGRSFTAGKLPRGVGALRSHLGAQRHPRCYPAHRALRAAGVRAPGTCSPVRAPGRRAGPGPPGGLERPPSRMRGARGPAARAPGHSPVRTGRQVRAGGAACGRGGCRSGREALRAAQRPGTRLSPGRGGAATGRLLASCSDRSRVRLRPPAGAPPSPRPRRARTSRLRSARGGGGAAGRGGPTGLARARGRGPGGGARRPGPPPPPSPSPPSHVPSYAAAARARGGRRGAGRGPRAQLVPVPPPRKGLLGGRFAACRARPPARPGAEAVQTVFRGRTGPSRGEPREARRCCSGGRGCAAPGREHPSCATGSGFCWWERGLRDGKVVFPRPPPPPIYLLKRRSSPSFQCYCLCK